VLAAVMGLASVERLSASKRLDLAIALPLRNQAALSILLAQIYDPASPHYRQYLTPEQFTERFGPTEEDYAAVVAFAKANALTVSATHPNRVLLDFNATVADIEKAFHVNMRVYQHPKEARTFYAPDAEPSLDLAVPVLHISGLDNYSLPRPRLEVTPVDKTKMQHPTLDRGRTERSWRGIFARLMFRTQH
jgi:subtilase family serine protease